MSGRDPMRTGSWSVLAAVMAAWACGIRPASGADVAAAVVAPRERITLYDGKTVKDLRHFTTWLADHGHEDPDRVFTVVDRIDGAPAIRISGEDWGGLLTRGRFRDYRLVVEFRWGTVTWKMRKESSRNSGILFHCQGEDGNHTADFKSPWIRSVEYEIQEGRTGAVVLVEGYERGQPAVIRPRVTMRTKADLIWDPTGEPASFDDGFLFQSTYDVGWRDMLGVRGPADRDAPVGGWNRVEIVSRGGDIAYFLNGTRILELTDSSFEDGRIMLQSEGAEIFYRLVELHPAVASE